MHRKFAAARGFWHGRTEHEANAAAPYLQRRARAVLGPDLEDEPD